ncbi:hypothetical protein [Nocardiopsis sp. RV163]|uniref:hypothetical protein n=1 Tax=Nocardiopsis sp. RV163 TaxID=1661388 RepID=UPI000B0BCCF3|nr:hypothetical protein [Nocardiopsis sp. RV163]
MAVSAEHRIHSESLADAPDTAVGFPLGLGAVVPGYDRSEVTSCGLGHVDPVDPVERRSDVAIMLCGPGPKASFDELTGIVVEVQRDEEERKRFTRPEYVASLRSRHERPVLLPTVCPKRSVADWYAGPIRLGRPGFVLRPRWCGGP